MIALLRPSLKPRRTAARRSKKEHLWTEPWVVWRGDGYRDLVCPACRTRSVMDKIIDASPPFEPRKRYALFRCGACGTLHYPDAKPVEYQKVRDADIARKYYVEIGAGLDAMFAPLAWAEPEAASSYLEVGGGYGFSIDFASRALGWRAAGVDPSSVAAVGARDLGYDLRRAYLSADDPAPDGPFDRVLSSEVIEHVRDPDPFLAAVAAAAGDNGVLMLTTPDAAAVSPGLSGAALLQIVVAGHHIVIFTAEGLTAALHRAGFRHIHVVSRDQTLLAVASRREVKADFGARPARDTYRRYLRERRDALAADPALYAGFAVRLLKECVHAGEFAEATEVLEALAARWRREYGLDIDSPSRIRPLFETTWRRARRAVRRYAGEHPFNLAVALFYAGRVREQEGRAADAEAAYRACVRAGKATMRVFDELAAPCRETEDCMRRAALHAAMLAAPVRPEQAGADVMALIPEEPSLPQDLWREARLRVFADGVLTGRREAVEPLALYAFALLEALRRNRLPFSVTEGFAAAALGMRALQDGTPGEAAPWFAAARDAMTDQRERAVFEAERAAAAQAAGGESLIEAAAALIAAVETGDASAAEAPAKRLSALGVEHPAISHACAFALGLRALNMTGEAKAAAAWFAHAALITADAAERAEALYHEILALEQAGEAASATQRAKALAAAAKEDAAVKNALGSRYDGLRRYKDAS